MFKVNNKYTRTLKVNDKVNNKDIVDVVLIFLLLTLNSLWAVNYQLGLLFVVLTLGALYSSVTLSSSRKLCSDYFSWILLLLSFSIYSPMLCHTILLLMFVLLKPLFYRQHNHQDSLPQFFQITSGHKLWTP